MKVNVFKFTDTKTGETFTGSIEDYRVHLNITKAALNSRLHTKRTKREWLGYKDNGRGKIRLTTYTDVKTGRSIFGTQSDAKRFFNLGYYSLMKRIDEGLIAVEPIKNTGVEDEPKQSGRKLMPDKKSDRKTKRLLNKHYLELAITLEYNSI